MDLYVAAKHANEMLSKLSFIAATQMDNLSGRNAAKVVFHIINENCIAKNLSNAVYEHEQVQKKGTIDFQI